MAKRRQWKSITALGRRDTAHDCSRLLYLLLVGLKSSDISVSLCSVCRHNSFPTAAERAERGATSLPSILSLLLANHTHEHVRARVWVRVRSWDEFIAAASVLHSVTEGSNCLVWPVFNNRFAVVCAFRTTPVSLIFHVEKAYVQRGASSEPMHTIQKGILRFIEWVDRFSCGRSRYPRIMSVSATQDVPTVSHNIPHTRQGTDGSFWHAAGENVVKFDLLLENPPPPGYSSDKRELEHIRNTNCRDFPPFPFFTYLESLYRSSCTCNA